MKRPLIAFLFGIGLLLLAQRIPAEIAQVTLVNHSIRMQPGGCSCGPGFTFTLSFSTYYTEDPARANGEIEPLPQPAAFSYWSYLVLQDISLFASTTYGELNLPMNTDSNGNGVPDFFDVGVAVSGGSSGRYAVPWASGYGQLLLTWNRSAGSSVGSCELYMDDPILGLMGPFNHSFELVSYFGELDYTPGTNAVTGTISLARNGNPGDVLEGPVSLVKAATNRFNLLTLSGSDWTNQAGVFTFGDCELTREPAQPALYHGLLEKPADPFRRWEVSIVDTNDTDGNGIPNLSDDLAITPPRPPFLSLSVAPQHLLLSVSGDIGRLHLLQQATNLELGAWTTVRSVVLTNDPQVFPLPLPVETPTFWRVEAR